MGAVFFLELCFVQPGVCDRGHPIKAMVPQSKGCRRYLLKRPFNLNGRGGEGAPGAHFHILKFNKFNKLRTRTWPWPYA